MIPQAKAAAGIAADDVSFTNEAVDTLIRNYCRESGVRNLQKQIEKVRALICSMAQLQLSQILRKAAVKIVQEKQGNIAITPETLVDFVGNPVFVSERLYDKTPPGVVMGLAWTAMGGSVLYIETVGLSQHSKDKSAGGGGFKVTGQLGDVMKESSTVSYINAKRFVELVDPGNSYFSNTDVHLHVPEGATPKDGPSAGISMTSALVSLATGRPLRQALAMTGEITLTGKVLRVGGIKEKLLAAKRAGVTLALLPRLCRCAGFVDSHAHPPGACEADFKELSEDVRSGIQVQFVETYDEVLQHAFDTPLLPAAAK